MHILVRPHTRAHLYMFTHEKRERGEKEVLIQGQSIKGISGVLGKTDPVALAMNAPLGLVMEFVGSALAKQGCSMLGAGVQRGTLA